jgi:hypothetical protein
MSMDLWYELLVRELAAFDQPQELAPRYSAPDDVTEEEEERRPPER